MALLFGCKVVCRTYTVHCTYNKKTEAKNPHTQSALVNKRGKSSNCMGMDT